MITSKPRRAVVLAVCTLASAFALATLGAGGGAKEEGPPAPEGKYTVDPVHSSVLFKIKHLNTTNFYGRFAEVAGTFDLQDGVIDVTIKTASITSGNAKRDQHLRSPDFFSVKEFPEANFKSSAVKKTGDHTYEATGDLTLHGVTKTVQIPIEHTGSGKGMKGNPIAGIEARATIKRSDFGMKFMPDLLGDDVEMIVALEGGR